MIHTTKKKLNKIFRNATDKDIDAFYDVFNKYAERFMIDTEVRENFFLAQIVAETGYSLKSVRENLNYTPDSLRKTFSRYRNNPKWSKRDGRTNDHKANQVNIGNIAYADRIGNGNIDSGDGYAFRGGGFFQLTGRANYDRMGEVIQQTIGDAVDGRNVADEITTASMGILSAMAFWLDNRCYECKDIDCVTEKINKYTDSYGKRKSIYHQIARMK